MKRALKFVGISLLILIVGAAAFAGYVAITGIPTYAPGHLALRVTSTPEKIERGRKYANLLCIGCHLDPATGKLTGKRLADVPKQFGEAYSKNITQDATHGIGAWSDGDLAYLLRTGITRTGHYTPPWMPKYPHMSDEDLESIIAFLRSDNPVLAPAAVDPPGVSQPTYLTKLLSHIAFKPLPLPKGPIQTPPVSDQVAYGRYLTSTLGCFGCHSANFRTMNELDPEKSEGYFGGGNEMRDHAGNIVRSANLTFDETGIATWSEGDFIRALRTGVRPDRTVFVYPMTPMPDLTDADASAIYAYLRTVPKIHHVFERPKRQAAVAEGGPGKALYASYGCNNCHGDNGQGVADLRHAAEHYPTDPQLEAFIRHAPSFKPGIAMPAWEGIIREGDYAPLISYVRELGRTAQEEK
jgi:mono/diheme cytochrome c family protein